MKKIQFHFLLISLFFIGCSPKYTEFKDQGFGGGFGKKGTQSIIRSNLNEVKPQEINTIECQINKFNQEISGSQDSTFDILGLKNKPFKIEKSSLKIPKNLNKHEIIQIKKETQKSILPNSKSSFLHWVYFIFSLCYLGYGISLLRDGILTWSKGNTFTDQMIGFFMSFFGLCIIIWGVCMLIFSYLFDKLSRKMCFTTKLGYALLPTFYFTVLGLILILIGSIYDRYHR